MPVIPLGNSFKQRETARMPIIRVVNLLVEQTETNKITGIDHIQRPGLEQVSTVGAGPIRGVFRQAGTLTGLFFIASGNGLYSMTSGGSGVYLGLIAGSERVSFAATASRVLIAAGGTCYSWNGTTLSTVAMPDGRPVTSVAQLNGYFLLTDGTTNSARIYYIEPGNTNPGGLDFFSTESVPGMNLKVERVGDELWMFKREGVEVHVPTGDADLPFQRVPGRNYDKGCRNPDTVVRFDNSVAWVGNDGLVYRGDNSPVRFSTHDVEEQVRKSDEDSLRAWTYALDGHTLYVLTMDRGTFAYDVSSQQWSEFKSWGRPSTWRAHVGDMSDTEVLAGDDTNGHIYRLNPDIANDNGDPMERILAGGVQIVGKPERCNNVQVYINTGSGLNVDATAELYVSDDLQTFSPAIPFAIPEPYGTPVRINAVGAVRYPGKLFKVRIIANVTTTISGMAYNEPAR